ncbi:toll/interleukin-1 receptor domain-containing protein [Heliobacterium chlorum]|uniref:Toll/interleukin-1 receptor domain-containing protein n=1 Tax=Heliobacterium chlorum TaxID=2698 RepID=A0ABR7T8S7_HELCL|nr:toll/interleukin-1 receptor domain-containing protein [Heliobacterium chlorum]MBC9786430.1 toll/interleukin-1 receptor domain-containing protein [Heliobacterium chlorum]
MEHEWDVFISHASEDKETVNELAKMLVKMGIKVWFDKFTLRLGDSLRDSIDYGLSKSRYGVVVISKNFFEKEWPKKELNGFIAREICEKKVVLPVWHDISQEEVLNFSPILADKLAAKTSDGLNEVANQITLVVNNWKDTNVTDIILAQEAKETSKNESKKYVVFQKYKTQIILVIISFLLLYYIIINISGVQNHLGVMYANGIGVVKNEIKAVEWYRKAAEQGNAEAQSNLGFMYASGRGVAKDDAKAVEWLLKAAEQGVAAAQYNLGMMYEDGISVSKDAFQAVEWYRKAAQQGHVQALYSLGRMYESGKGVAQDQVQAVKLLSKAAERGDVYAQFSLGGHYYSGKGIDKDKAKAFGWYSKAAEQGYVGAEVRLGIFYESGDVVQKDIAKAVEWYRKAAEQGDGYAQGRLFQIENER